MTWNGFLIHNCPSSSKNKMSQLNIETSKGIYVHTLLPNTSYIWRFQPDFIGCKKKIEINMLFKQKNQIKVTFHPMLLYRLSCKSLLQESLLLREYLFWKPIKYFSPFCWPWCNSEKMQKLNITALTYPLYKNLGLFGHSGQRNWQRKTRSSVSDL